MKLNQLGSDFGLMSQTEQRVFFHKYIEKRTTDLAEPTVFKKPGRASKGKNVAVTSEALEILKKLGLIL